MHNLTLFLILVLAVAVFLRLDFTFYIVYVVVGLVLVARVGYKRAIANLDWDRTFLDRAFLGDRLQVSIQVRNRSWLPLPWLRISDSVPVNLYGQGHVRKVASLMRHETVQIQYWLDCNRRGYYCVGPISLAAGDPLGFSEYVSNPQSEAVLVVYPQVLTLTALGLESQQPFGTLRANQHIFDDPVRISGVRDYRTSDSVRTIHWKASAHADSLQVKKVDPAIALETTILLNISRGDYHRQTWQSASEWGIVVAASVAYHLTQVGQAVGLSVNGLDPERDMKAPPDIPPRGGQRQLMQMLEVLARVEADEGDPFNFWVTRATLNLNWGTTVLVISPQVDDLVTATLHQLKRRGLQVALIAIEPYANFGTIVSRCKYLGISAYNITKRIELDNLT